MTMTLVIGTPRKGPLILGTPHATVQRPPSMYPKQGSLVTCGVMRRSGAAGSEEGNLEAYMNFLLHIL